VNLITEQHGSYFTFTNLHDIIQYFTIRGVQFYLSKQVYQSGHDKP